MESYGNVKYHMKQKKTNWRMCSKDTNILTSCHMH